MAADQFCLRWNNFQVNITSALESLKSDEDLVDVTLTCEGQNVKAHKVILSACSPYFRNVFKENPCQHPVVILKDVKYEDVTALLNFMYHGEVYITQDRLAPFLHTAELLQVRGLTGAANPFKDLQTPPPTLQSKTLQQLQIKVKNNPVQFQSGQIRRVTPPLSASPSSLPLAAPVKTHKTPRSPLVSPPPKDLSASATSSISKEKLKDSMQMILSRESEIDLPTKSASPVGMAVQAVPSSVNFSGSNEQPSTSYSPIYPEQSAFSAPASPAIFQHSNDSSSQLLPLQFTNVSKGQNLTQPSSPPAGKRRKTFPRRVSSSQMSSDQTESPLNMSDSAKEISQDSMEPVESETYFKDVSVKVEHSDDDVDNEQDEEEGSPAYTQEITADVDVKDGEFSKEKTDFDSQLLEEQGLIVDETGDVGSVPANQSMLLHSLSGQPHGISQGDGGELTQRQIDELNTLPPWTESIDRCTHVHFGSENWEVEPRISDNTRMVEMENFNVSHAGTLNLLPISVAQLQQSVISVNRINNVPEESSYNQPYRQKIRMLYQKRKHSWHSRRPVQCPNCNKTISMAYNLKSHLNSCLKRLGVVENSINA